VTALLGFKIKGGQRRREGREGEQETRAAGSHETEMRYPACLHGAAAGCLLLALVPIGHVSSFVLTPSAKLGAPGALRSPRVVALVTAQRARCGARPGASSRPLSAVVMSALPDALAGQDGERPPAPALARRVWDMMTALVRAFIVKTAVLVSLFAIGPGLALAAKLSHAADPAAVEAPVERVHRWAPTDMLHSHGGGDCEGVAGERSVKRDMAQQLEDAETFSQERKNWLYSPKAQQVGMTLVSAASLGGYSSTSGSHVLVAKAEQLQQPVDHAAEAMRHTTAAASELASAAQSAILKLAQKAGADLTTKIASITPEPAKQAAESAKQAVLQTSEAVRSTSNTVTVKVSDLMREHDPTVQAVSAKLESVSSAIRTTLQGDARPEESTASKAGGSTGSAAAAAPITASSAGGVLVSSNGNVPASKSWSVFRGTEAILAEDAASKGAAMAAADALEYTNPGSQAELQARFPNWQKTTRAELLKMDFKHHHHDDDHDAPVHARDVLAQLTTPLTWAFGFIKLMFPLTMLSVPIIWVFPWELLTGGFKSSRKFFNDAPGSTAEEATANRAREKILWASTVLNVIVSVIFGGSGGGGGGHH